jgi:hypothetical protein
MFQPGVDFSEFLVILACPSISRIQPSGNVQRLRDSLLEVFCYVNTTVSGNYNVTWAFHLDTPGKLHQQW